MADKDEMLNKPLQESCLTLLVHDDKHGRVIANMLTPEQFDGDYSAIARAAINYWKKHSAPPKHHLDDMLGDVIGNKDHPKSRVYFEILQHMIRLYDAGLNSAFYVDHVYRFTRLQQIKQAIFVAAGKLQSKSDMALEDIEDTLTDLMKVKQAHFDHGLELTDIDRVLSYFETKQEDFTSGIAELDARGCVPARDAVMLLLGGTGRGKSWGLIHIAKHALLQRKKVLHVSLEMPKEEVVGRYWQSLYSMARTKLSHKVTTITRDGMGKLESLNVENIESDFAFNSPFIRDELTTRLAWSGQKLHNNLRVVSFPSGSMRVRDLNAYLDMQQQVGNFVPDMIVVDYIGLMRIEGKEHRIAIGDNMVGLRGIAQERHVAIVTAQQVSRKGATTHQINLTHVSEDWSLTNTSDYVLTYTSTDSETNYGLGRLYVAKARGVEDKYGVLLTQNYGIGQFAIDSIPLEKKYFDRLNELSGFEAPTEEEDEEDEEDDDNYRSRR